MLSTTAQYALRAMVYIASLDPDQWAHSAAIASKTGVPAKYLSRILYEAVRAGFLKSARGAGGGFKLARPRERIKLIDVMSRFDDVLDKAKCPFGQARCSDSNPCGFHEHWKPISTAYREMLENTSLADIGLDGMGGQRD